MSDIDPPYPHTPEQRKEIHLCMKLHVENREQLMEAAKDAVGRGKTIARFFFNDFEGIELRMSDSPWSWWRFEREKDTWPVTDIKGLDELDELISSYSRGLRPAVKHGMIRFY